MKDLMFLLSFLISLNINAQSVELITEVNKNVFYQKDIHLEPIYSSAIGHSLKIGFSGKRAKLFSWMVTLGYDRYGGEINVFNGGFGGGIRTIAKIDKAVLTFAMYPLNFKLWNRIDFNFGIEISNLFYDGFEGSRKIFATSSNTNIIEDLNSVFISYNSKYNFGYRGRIAYDIKIADHIYLSPQYIYHRSVTSEFKENPEATRSIRHYFGLGIEKKL